MTCKGWCFGCLSPKPVLCLPRCITKAEEVSVGNGLKGF